MRLATDCDMRGVEAEQRAFYKEAFLHPGAVRGMSCGVRVVNRVTSHLDKLIRLRVLRLERPIHLGVTR